MSRFKENGDSPKGFGPIGTMSTERFERSARKYRRSFTSTQLMSNDTSPGLGRKPYETNVSSAADAEFGMASNAAAAAATPSTLRKRVLLHSFLFIIVISLFFIVISPSPELKPFKPPM
jgi:hypothetical protein